MAEAFYILIVLKRQGISPESARKCWEKSHLLERGGACLWYPLRFAQKHTQHRVSGSVCVHTHTQENRG